MEINGDSEEPAKERDQESNLGPWSRPPNRQQYMNYALTELRGGFQRFGENPLR